MSGRRWTADEDAILLGMYPDTPTKIIATTLNRSERSVYMHADILGIKKSEEYLKSEQSGRISKLGELGAKYRFKKGQQPVNKGKEMISWMPAESIKKSAATRFKKGNIPPNTNPLGDGAITIRNDKSGRPYKYIRVKLAKWELLSRVLWEQINGPIPPKHVIVFKDNNTLNCEIGNLECISMRDNMKRNSYHRFGKEIASAVQLRGAITRQINKHTKRLKK